MTKVRLDQLLVERGLAPSRAAAQAMLIAGEVELAGAGSRNLKPGQSVPADAEVNVTPQPRWASRAAGKLEAALDAFAVDPGGLVCLDAGASTGGFTDVLLERGAATVYAVDVGRGQLIDRLRRHPRVVSMERTNLRTLAELPATVELATLDLSFISLRLVLPTVRRLVAVDGRVVALVKPQFEAGRDAVPRGGVLRDPSAHAEVLHRFGADARSAGFGPLDLIRSPITGTDGNIEFLALLGSPPGLSAGEWDARVDALTGAVG
ncbi:MAG TPA: TlyA family RNA methyltransferase [Candidatus Limnocylindrales bacterium]|nr:TlyA family RNA methyltransferase [Candidatus Limnocylindrales bacterium]